MTRKSLILSRIGQALVDETPQDYAGLAEARTNSVSIERMLLSLLGTEFDLLTTDRDRADAYFKHFFYGALYECGSERKIWSLNYCTLRPSLFPDPNFGELGAFFPTKGTTVTPGSLVDMAIGGGKPYLVRILTLLDGMPKEGKTIEGLVAMARPMLISGNPAKVALVVVLGRNRNLLDPQVKRIIPEIVKGFHSNLY